MASELLSFKSPSRCANTDISLCFLWRSSTSCFHNHRQKGDMQAVSAYSQTHEYYLAKLAQHWEMNEMMSNHASIPAIANDHIGNILFLHLQTAILWLVCEVCEAGRTHDTLAEFPLSPRRRPLGPETAYTNWLPVQRGARPVGLETAHPDIPAVSVIYTIKEKNKI